MTKEEKVIVKLREILPSRDVDIYLEYKNSHYTTCAMIGTTRGMSTERARQIIENVHRYADHIERGHVFYYELSNRSQTALLRYNVVNKINSRSGNVKEIVKSYVENNPRKFYMIRNLGRKSINEIIKWCGARESLMLKTK